MESINLSIQSLKGSIIIVVVPTNTEFNGLTDGENRIVTENPDAEALTGLLRANVMNAVVQTIAEHNKQKAKSDEYKEAVRLAMIKAVKETEVKI